MTQWVAPLTRNVEAVGSRLIKGPVVSLSKKLYPYCLILLDSRNEFERDIKIELNSIENLTED